MPVRRPSVLISGVAGFLGSHLADAFLADGWEVAGVDSLIGGYRDNVPAGVAFHEADCNDLVRMRATLGRNAERLRLVYLGPSLPAEALTALAPLQAGSDDTNAFADLRAKGDGGLALALVDPGGYLMMRYAEGYDLGGVRRDLPKVVK